MSLHHSLIGIPPVDAEVTSVPHIYSDHNQQGLHRTEAELLVIHNQQSVFSKLLLKVFEVRIINFEVLSIQNLLQCALDTVYLNLSVACRLWSYLTEIERLSSKGEGERRAFGVLRNEANSAREFSNEQLRYDEAQTYALGVDLFLLVFDGAKHFEQLGFVLVFDAKAGVFNIDPQHLGLLLFDCDLD